MQTQEQMIELMTRKEPLCDELQACFSDDGSFPMVRHPLVYSVPHNDCQNALLNFQLQDKKREVKKMLDEGDYPGYVFMHEKPYRLNAFVEIKDKLKNEDYWNMLGEVWQNSENIWQNLDEWKILLRDTRPDKEKFMDADELSFYNALPDVVTAYRGYIPGKNMAGLSYSLSREKAEWFAARWKEKGKVLTIKIPKKKIFAYLNGRNEQEIIIL